jgi:RNA polymerase sigma-70 factor, ECF subfamily
MGFWLCLENICAMKFPTNIIELKLMSDIADLPDEKIVELVRSKDKELYSQIIKRYEDKLMRYALYITQDEDKAADVAQETFIKAFVNLKSFETNKKFSSWIYRITHNEAIRNIKHDKKQIPILENTDFDSGINLEDDFIKKELQTHTRKCLSQIPLIYKEPLSLFFLEEKSYEEISDILRIPIGTVGTRINRAKVLMKKICQRKN